MVLNRTVLLAMLVRGIGALIQLASLRAFLPSGERLVAYVATLVDVTGLVICFGVVGLILGGMLL